MHTDDLRKHSPLKCGGCGILVGPNHITRELHRFLDGLYCETCLQGRRRLGCASCGAHQIKWDHETFLPDEIAASQKHDEREDGVKTLSHVVIDGVCRVCGARNMFVDGEPVTQEFLTKTPLDALKERNRLNRLGKTKLRSAHADLQRRLGEC